MAHSAGHEGRQGALAQRRVPPARAADGARRGGPATRSRVRVVPPAGLPLSPGSGRAERSCAGGRADRRDHLQAARSASYVQSAPTPDAADSPSDKSSPRRWRRSWTPSVSDVGERQPRRAPRQVQLDCTFDRLRDSKIAQAYTLLVPACMRPVTAHGMERPHADGGGLHARVLESAARSAHDREPDGGAGRMGPRRSIWRCPGNGSSKTKAIAGRLSNGRDWNRCATWQPPATSRWCSCTVRTG